MSEKTHSEPFLAVASRGRCARRRGGGRRAAVLRARLPRRVDGRDRRGLRHLQADALRLLRLQGGPVPGLRRRAPAAVRGDRRRVRGAEEPEQALRAGVEAFLAFADEQRATWTVLFAEGGRFNEAAAAIRAEQAGLIAQLLRELPAGPQSPIPRSSTRSRTCSSARGGDRLLGGRPPASPSTRRRSPDGRALARRARAPEPRQQRDQRPQRRLELDGLAVAWATAASIGAAFGPVGRPRRVKRSRAQARRRRSGTPQLHRWRGLADHVAGRRRRCGTRAGRPRARPPRRSCSTCGRRGTHLAVEHPEALLHRRSTCGVTPPPGSTHARRSARRPRAGTVALPQDRILH